MRGRPPLPIGVAGDISATQSGAAWIARCRYRDVDGLTRQVKASGRTKKLATEALKVRLKDRRQMGGEEIGQESTVAVLAEAWFRTIDQSQATQDKYRHALDKHVIPHLGPYRLREATTARLDGFLRRTVDAGPAVAKQCRVVLGLMFGMAARYDAVPANPVTATKLPAVKAKPVKALTVEQVIELREDIAAWAHGKASRAQTVDVVDLFIATGLRPGELLAIRYEDVDLKARTLTVSGTVKRDSVNGLHRQSDPKSEAGKRVLVLPDFAVSMIRRRKLASTSKLVFPNRNGEPLEPANFRRTWREARGTGKWEHVEQRAFRRAVATLIERESGSLAASKQLGHGSDAVTIKHYIEKNQAAPDATSVLSRFRSAQ